jgi:hypothetical protein
MIWKYVKGAVYVTGIIIVPWVVQRSCQSKQ